MPDNRALPDAAELATSQQRLALFEAVFEEIPDVIVLKDAEGNFLLCNQTLARLYNTTPEAMVGKHDGDFGVPKALADAYRANVLGIMARGETEVVFEDSRNAITGEIRHFKSIKRPFKDAQGNNQILVIAHDITDVVRAQQQVAQSEQRLQEVMTATREGIWDWHVASGRVVHNPQWYRILGFAEGEIIGHVDAFSARIHPDDKPLVWQRLRQLLSGEREFYNSEHRMLCKDGSIIWVLDRGRVAERNAQGEPARVVGTYVDISERKRHELELNQALALAQSATRAKSDFLATMSHELRTPLNGILGMAQLLLMPKLTESDLNSHARTILSSGQTLLGLLNDLLDLSKVEAGKLKLYNAPFSPQQLMQDTVVVFQQLAVVKGVQLQVSHQGLKHASYWGDSNRLQQMLANYLSNAIKFTAQGWVKVEVAQLTDATGQTWLEFAVQDSGIGIAPEQQALLFQPFTQADSTTTRQFGGTGLGLSIVARMAELMGGQVGLQSQPGQGSRFWFRVPAQVPPMSVAPEPSSPPLAAPATRAAAGSSAALQGRVLVAEDHAVNRVVIEALLASVGLQAEVVENGHAAFEAVRRGPNFDVILMDVQMPVMDGQQATRCIRQWETDNGAPRTRIIALTAGALAEDRQRCLEVGMDDFLTKPIDRDALTQTLTRWLVGAA
ncbi:PAS domain S-box protein [Rhodoferax sp. 4810]|nr:PAS domain S-box protein [Rhodoferax jenense]